MMSTGRKIDALLPQTGKGDAELGGRGLFQGGRTEIAEHCVVAGEIGMIQGDYRIPKQDEAHIRRRNGEPRCSYLGLGGRFLLRRRSVLGQARGRKG